MRRAPPIPRLLALTACLLAGFAALAPGGPRAQSLVSDLSNHLVAITSDYTGAEVLLFGSIEAEGDLVVTVSGPRQPVTVRRKERVVGVWMNTEAVEFRNTPAFYAVAATGPIEEIASPEVRGRQEMGVEHLALRATPGHALTPERVAQFRDGLIRNKIRQGLYSPEVAPIQVLSDRLFRTVIALPSNPTEGTYTVSVYLLQNGMVLEAQTNPLIVSKTGIWADLFLFAHDRPAVYGVLAIVVAVLAGWLAAVIFRKV